MFTRVRPETRPGAKILSCVACVARMACEAASGIRLQPGVHPENVGLSCVSLGFKMNPVPVYCTTSGSLIELEAKKL